MIRPPDEKEPAAGAVRWRARVSMALCRAAAKILLRRWHQAKAARRARDQRIRALLEAVVADQRGEGRRD
jgi:hypothetical protein